MVVAGLLPAFICQPADAQVPRVDDDTWRVRSVGGMTADGGLIFGLPAALENGFSRGVAAGLMFGRRLAAGVRVSWSTATESSLAWTVSHADLRLRATAAIQQEAGRGRFALRLGLGPTIVRETRLRNQGARAGLTGTALGTSALAALPAGDLEAVVAVHIAGRWLLMLSGGPSVSVVDRTMRAGWTAQLGAGWQP